MKHIYPDFYNKFKCIANKCPDSCCKDWDVVVDDESDKFYSTVNGEFGEKLRRLTITDNDGDRIFVSQNARCPFWNNDMLCDIYINLGEEHLCATCRNFPRITQDYTVFTEHTLSFACPEAARLMLAEDNAYKSFDNYDISFENVDYDAKFMQFLLKARKATSDIFTNRQKPFAQRLKEALAFNNMVQTLVDEEDFCSGFLNYDISESNHSKADCSFVFALHKKLEIMDDNWRSLLSEAEKYCNDKVISTEYDAEFERLSLYYIYRYYLNAIDSYDVLSTIKRIACAYLVVGKISSQTPDIVRLMQQCSKEVEHSYENSETLEFEFATSSDFSVDNFIDLI